MPGDNPPRLCSSASEAKSAFWRSRNAFCRDACVRVRHFHNIRRPRKRHNSRTDYNRGDGKRKTSRTGRARRLRPRQRRMDQTKTGNSTRPARTRTLVNRRRSTAKRLIRSTTHNNRHSNQLFQPVLQPALEYVVPQWFQLGSCSGSCVSRLATFELCARLPCVMLLVCASGAP